MGNCGISSLVGAGKEIFVKVQDDVVTLCGSVRFKREFLEEEDRLTREGFVVLKPGCWNHLSDSEMGEMKELKDMLIALHLRKIDMSNRIHVINKDGYVGRTTLAEIKYAFDKDLSITKMEPQDDPKA